MRATPLLVGMTLLTLAACDVRSSQPATELSLSTTTTQTATTAGPRPTAPSFAPVRLDLSEDGRYLVDGEGRAVYMFTLDDQRVSTCEGACAEVWPPLMGTPEAGPGVDEGHLGNAERRGGGIQVTYAGQPLYHYAEDSVGDTTGHGFNDFWFLVDPAGGPLND